MFLLRISAMGTNFSFFFILLGFSLCVGAPLDVLESSTSTSVSVSTVTRKVTSRSFLKDRSESLLNETIAVTEDMMKTQESKIEDAPKVQKIKKKVLASNLKNIMADKPEKLVNPVNFTEGDSLEDAILEEAGKTETKTENLTLKDESKKKDGRTVEGRSLEDFSSEENVNVNVKSKTRIPSSTTDRTPNGYYETFGGLQKLLSNNYLNNNEGYDSRVGRPSPSVILPAKKPSPITKDNSLKNAIRFDSEYYGPTGQTDWVPIIPDKLPVKSRENTQHFGSKLKPVFADKANKTNEMNSIVFPSDGAQSLKESNSITLKEMEKTTVRTKSSVQTKVSNTTEEGKINVTQPLKLLKFRGAVKYKQSNLTIDDKQNGTVLKKNISLDLPAMGASGGKSSAKPMQEETTEISIVSSTNHTTKSQNAVDSGLAVPPENVKVDNVTKEPQLKNTIPSNVEPINHNYSDISKVIENGQGWIPIVNVKPENDTDVIIPKIININHRNETVEVTKSSTMEVETISDNITTEESATTETLELTTFPKMLITATENIIEADTSSQTNEDAVTAQNEESVKPSEDVKGPISTVMDGLAVPTTVAPVSFEGTTNEDIEISTQPVADSMPSTTNGKVLSSTERGTEVNVTSAPPVISTYTSSLSIASTTPKLFLLVNATTEDISFVNMATTTTKATTASIAGIMSTSFKSSSVPSVTPTTSTTTQTTGTTMLIGVVPSTPAQNNESKFDVTEQGIYYKNYIPTTINPHDEITEENVPAYLRLTIQAKSWEELCRLKDDLREAVMAMLCGNNVTEESVHFLNLNDRNCQEKIEGTRGEVKNGTVFLPVNMFLMDKSGDFDKNLSEAFLTLWGRRGLDFELPIRKVDFVTPIVKLTELADSPLGGSVVAAIVISCVAGICVILLGTLFVIMKRRQKRFNYGQRCTPVSLDAYSLDSVSIYNSVRRKGVRASKRSYGNAAFDDPEVPTHPMNFAGLANFSSDKEQLYEEFNIIPQVYPKVEELPPGAETKNRYANIIPLPETRVHLTVKDGDALSDYINANYVRGLKGVEKLYIACQAPLESTIEDFWRMVWEQQSKVILMLTDLQENGIEKCADYLPPNEVTDNLRLFGDFQVTLKKRDVKEKYIISNLKLKNMETNLWREVTHLWYLGWPDQGVPPEANSLIAFLIEARSQMKIQNGATTSSPVVVHCSPGTGRTGTVIACDLCIREYEQTRMVDIPKCVFNLRKDRAGAVQTKDQYAFIYQVLNVYATKLSGGGIESI